MMSKISVKKIALNDIAKHIEENLCKLSMIYSEIVKPYRLNNKETTRLNKELGLI